MGVRRSNGRYDNQKKKMKISNHHHRNYHLYANIEEKSGLGDEYWLNVDVSVAVKTSSMMLSSLLEFMMLMVHRT